MCYVSLPNSTKKLKNKKAAPFLERLFYCLNLFLLNKLRDQTGSDLLGIYKPQDLHHLIFGLLEVACEKLI